MQSPESGKKGDKRRLVIIIVAVLVLLLCCLGSTCGLLIFKLVADSRISKADSAIGKAETDLKKAKLATEPSTQEETELAKAVALLSEAKKLRNKASYIDLGPYKQANRKADESAKTSQIILTRVSDMLAEADQRDENEPFDEYIKGYFAVYEQYPRTQEANQALGSAEYSLQQEIEGTLTLDKLTTIALFNKLYPVDEKPDEAKQTARDEIIMLATTRIDDLKECHQIDQTWCNQLSVGGKTQGSTETEFQLQPIGNEEATEMQKIMEAMPDLAQESDSQRLASLLCEGCRLVQQCRMIAESPVSVEGNMNYYNGDQIAAVSNACAQMIPIISEIEKILKDLGEE